MPSPNTLSAAQRAKVRRLSRPRDADEGETGELNIVPFLDIIVNILIFVLATVAVTFTASLETTPPASRSAGVRQAAPKEALNLTVFVVEGGFALKASGGNVAEGCTGRGAGLAVPKRTGEYDFVGLKACGSKLKAEYPDERQFYIAANPGTEYQTLIHVMDALRETEDGAPLFPEANFKVPR